jgi:Fanconi anemia group M protein
LQISWQIPIIFSHSKEDSVEILVMIGRQDEVITNVVNMRGGYRPKKLKNRQLYLLQGLPDVGPKLAHRLLDHFKSAFRVMSATSEELMEVDGVGQTRARRIRKVLDSENMPGG